jgi:hypothetical protein
MKNLEKFAFASAGASRLLPSKTNATKVWVVYQKNMRKTILLAGYALLLGTTVIASDFAADPLSFRNPQQDLFDNLSEMIRETKELQSCEKQQEEALQRFLEVGLSLNAAALMAHNQYPCDCCQIVTARPLVVTGSPAGSSIVTALLPNR